MDTYYFQLKLLTKLWINFRYDFISCQMSSIKDKNIKKLRKYKKIFGPSSDKISFTIVSSYLELLYLDTVDFDVFMNLLTN